MTPTSPGQPRSLAAKLAYLFDRVRREDGSEWTGKDVAAAVRARGTDLSASHLSELRRGVKANPTVRVLQGLADFFQVRVSYFFDDATAVEQTLAELELREAMRDADVRQVATRVADFSTGQRAAFQRLLADLIKQHDPGQPPEPAD